MQARIFDIQAQSIGQMAVELKPFINNDYWVEWSHGVIPEIEAVSTDGRYYYPCIEVTDLKTGQRGYVSLSKEASSNKYNAWGSQMLAHHVIDRARGMV